MAEAAALVRKAWPALVAPVILVGWKRLGEGGEVQILK